VDTPTLVIDDRLTGSTRMRKKIATYCLSHAVIETSGSLVMKRGI